MSSFTRLVQTIKYFVFPFFTITSLFLILSGASCEKEEEEIEPDRYAFWQSEITSFYYCYDMENNLTHQVLGKPFMVLEYDPVTGVPLKCEFGLSEAENKYLPGVEYAIPEALLNASSMQYSKRLDLVSPVSLLCNWDAVSAHEELSSGGYEFRVDHPNGESYHFTFTFDGMEGEIENTDGEWGERVSDSKAFKLLRKFNSNTVGN